MALVAATLGGGLAAMSPTDNESVAIDAFVTAWEGYFSTAMAGPVPVVPGSLAGALESMRGALSGFSGEDQGGPKIQAAITAFWGTVAGAAGSIWPASTAATPPGGLGGIGSALSGAFSGNASGNLDLATSAMNVANALHPTQMGGMAIFPVPPAGIGPQAIA